MTATVGASLSGVTFALRHAGEGPFMSSTGNVYFFGRDSVNTGQVEPHKATDPMSAFTAQTLKTMSSGTTTAIEAMACYQVSDVIHIVAQISTGATYYNTWNMATDAWGLTTSETAVAAASFAPSTGYTFVDLVVRSTGEVVIAYCAGQTAMASTFNMIRGTRRTGTNTYSALASNIDNGGSVSWTGCVAALGASDRVHFFIRDHTNTLAYQRTLSAANSLETFPSAFDSTPGALHHQYTPPISYVSGGTTKVRTGYRDASPVSSITVASLDSADTPTVSTTAAVGDTPVDFSTATGFHVLASMLANGTEEHVLFVDAASDDVYYDKNTGSGWGTDSLELSGAGVISKISTPRNAYVRGGNTVLAMVVDDGGTLKYAEITLAAAATTSLPWPMETSYRILSRR